MFRFERLDVWQDAIGLSDRVYKLTRRFPDEERYDLSSQMRRSAVSIAANIAEGSGRASDVEYARFIEIASGSLMERVSHLIIARRQGLLSDEEYDDLYAACERTGKRLSALRTRLRSSR